jgi:cell fate (sporulation/competence/biofilm development) regulator YlbF (YheA/YmcA/DUF963 family)
MDEAVKIFTSALKESAEYRTYLQAKEKVKAFPELKREIDEYRKRNYELQSKSEIEFESIEEFEKEYEALLENPLAADFLAAELAFCRMMQEISFQITESFDFE